MGLLEPWIRAGIIELIPSPVDYDYKLKMETFKLAEIRLKDWTPSQEDIEESEPYTIRETMRFLSNLPKEAMIQHIKNTTPNINDKEVETLIQHFENDRKNDPYALNQTFNGEEKVGQFNLMRTGANLEMALYLSQLTGAYPYTNIRKSWEELLTSKDDLNETSKMWTPLTKAFQQLDFNFLNNVNVNFIQNLKEKDRIQSY